MNTTVIIILGALILIVVIAIVVVLVKGKGKSSHDQVDESSTNTFQEISEDNQSGVTEPEPELTTPKLHQQNNQTPPNPVAMDDLTTPQQTPATQPSNMPNLNQPLQTKQPSIQQNVPINSPVQGNNMYQSNPLPDPSQIQNDMANLQNSQDISTPQVTPQPTTVPNKSESDIQNIANSINQAQKVQKEEEENVGNMGFNPPVQPQQKQPEQIQPQATDDSSMKQNTPTQQPPVGV